MLFQSLRVYFVPVTYGGAGHSIVKTVFHKMFTDTGNIIKQQNTHPDFTIICAGQQWIKTSQFQVAVSARQKRAYKKSGSHRHSQNIFFKCFYPIFDIISFCLKFSDTLCSPFLSINKT